MSALDARWIALSQQTRKRIDELLSRRQMFDAIVVLRQETGPALSLFESQDILAQRRRELHRQGLVEPEPPPPTTAQLIERATAGPAPVVAVEAVWDGDTQGWCVVLVAIVRHRNRFDEVPLTVIRHGGDIRLFNGSVPPWPEAGQAIDQGRAVAHQLGVPFHFTSPEEPDIDLPRWWDTAEPQP